MTQRFVSRAGSNLDSLNNQLTRTGTIDSSNLRGSVTYSDYDAHDFRRAKRRLSRSSVNFSLHPHAAIELEDAIAPSKLGTVQGALIPTIINTLSIIMFLRFGYILSEAGILGMFMLLTISYFIGLMTALSVSAIATNGTVRGGGAYYLASRSLGPEFGGSVGVIFTLGQIANVSLNVVGLMESIFKNFGSRHGEIAQILPEGRWWMFAFSTFVLILSTIVCLFGSKLFARATMALAFILGTSILSIFATALFLNPFTDPENEIVYTGFQASTFYENLWPKFTQSPAGGSTRAEENQNFTSVFAVLFPACVGILAGASMSGDLRKPSKSIPRGTLGGLGVTFGIYSLVILIMGFTITRDSLIKDLSILQDVSISPFLIVIGTVATSLFSILVGILSAAKIIQAMARDNLIPFLSPFAKGTADTDDPILAMLASYLIAQVMLLYNSLNDVAAFVTMAHLLTFAIINLACFLLKVGSAPNFRPTFHFFKAWTALLGFVMSVMAMILIDGFYASISFFFVAIVFSLIHYLGPPKSWGDVSQAIIYHQVRKYLLRLDSRKDHVKFWRPQILLLVNDPRRKFALIQLCNALKKGSLYVLGHVIKGDFQSSLPELRKQQNAWLKFIDVSNIKAFVDIIVAENEPVGARSLVMCCGLGGMKPNIVVMGSFNLRTYMERQQKQAPQDEEEAQIHIELPTDADKIEEPISPMNYVTIVEDVLAADKALAIAFKISNFQMPSKHYHGKKRYIDLWPIQMSAPQEASSAVLGSDSVTNFDTYTLVLQLGTILHMIPAWRDNFILRVMVFVEYSDDVEEERRKVQKLLDNLRIPAELVVLWLASGDVMSYETIVRGKGTDPHVEELLKNDPWWIEQKSFKASSMGPSNSTASARRQPSEEAPLISEIGDGFGGHTSSPGGNLLINMPLPAIDQRLLAESSEEESDSDENEDEDYQDAGGKFFPRARTWTLPSENERLPPLLRSKTSNTKSYGAVNNRYSSYSDGNKPSIRRVEQRSTSIQFAQPHLSHQPSHTSIQMDQSRKLDFNALPLRAQLIICNDLMRLYSEKSALLFTSFPAPIKSASKDEKTSLDFLSDLDILGSCGCPTVLVHSKTLTVTMSL